MIKRHDAAVADEPEICYERVVSRQDLMVTVMIACRDRDFTSQRTRFNGCHYYFIPALGIQWSPRGIN